MSRIDEEAHVNNNQEDDDPDEVIIHLKKDLPVNENDSKMNILGHPGRREKNLLDTANNNANVDVDDNANTDHPEEGLVGKSGVDVGANADPPQDAVVRGRKKCRRPPRHAFFQQKLTGWTPVLTAWTVIPFIFFAGVVSVPIGLGILSFSNKVTEITIPYTDCVSTVHSDLKCADIVSKDKNAFCECEVPFTLDKQLQHQVYVYYALTNFFQNHRRYVKSRDEDQLAGYTDGKPDDDCKPFAYKDGKKIYPCGAVANSLFSDEISMFYHTPKGVIKPVGLIRTGIAWNLDKKLKFKNPKDFSETSKMWETCTKPKDWKKELWQLDTENPENNGIENEDFIVWMRIANLPNFRKPYRIVNVSAEGFIGGLPKGNYTLKINYSYLVHTFGGTKSIIISNTSLFGGSNDFLGITFIIVGGVSLLLGLVLLIEHIRKGKSVSENIDIDAKTPWDVNEKKKKNQRTRRENQQAGRENQPNAGENAEDQDANGENQDANRENLDANGENQEANEENQEANEENQEANEENQDANGENQDANGENQPTDGDNQSSDETGRGEEIGGGEETRRSEETGGGEETRRSEETGGGEETRRSEETGRGEETGGGEETRRSEETGGGEETGRSEKTEGGEETGGGDETRGGEETGRSEKTEGGEETGRSEKTEGGEETGRSEETGGHEKNEG